MLMRRIVFWIVAYLAFHCVASTSSMSDVDLAGVLSPSMKKYLGSEVSNLGSSVGKAGDVNGDGKVDLLLAAAGVGVVYVVFGKGNMTTTADVDLTNFSSGSSGFRIFNSQLGEIFTFSVSGLKDLNNDGYSDIAIGVQSANIVYVIFGHSRSTQFTDIDIYNFIPAPTVGITISKGNSMSGDKFGNSVADAGDVNGDGISDLIVGSSGSSAVYNNVTRTASGISFVVFGSSTIASFSVNSIATAGTTQGFAILGAVSADNSGTAVSAAGDVNGDGTDDFLIGSPLADPMVSTMVRQNAGVVYVLFGRKQSGGSTSYANIDLSPLNTAGSPLGFAVYGAANNDQTGNAIGFAGDVNGDGLSDLIMGASRATTPVLAGVSRAYAGMSYVLFGRSPAAYPTTYFSNIDLLALNTAGSALGFSIWGAASSDGSGTSVSGAGDVNRDGLSDVIVGAPMADVTVNGIARVDAGVSYVLFGRSGASNPSYSYANIDLANFGVNSGSTLGFRILGAINGDNSGQKVSVVGDFNGDVSSDLVIGAAMSRVDAGTAFVVFGAFPDPTSLPTLAPSAPPTKAPTAAPNAQPTPKPSTRQPSSAAPVIQPTSQPTSHPTAQPTSRPTSRPSIQPTRQPTGQPSRQPSRQPTSQPSRQPASHPTGQPTNRPSGQPTSRPSGQPVAWPSVRPSTHPTARPTSQPTSRPTAQPSAQPSEQPSAQPSSVPSALPSHKPSSHPSSQPSSRPTAWPSIRPVAEPTSLPTLVPTVEPSSTPSAAPSSVPSAQPSSAPTSEPTAQPSAVPTTRPVAQPTGVPTTRPTSRPSAQPTSEPTSEPSCQPTSAPSAQPTSQPTAVPSSTPSARPTASPSGPPSARPSPAPTAGRTVSPTVRPSEQPSLVPTADPTVNPTADPTVVPTAMSTAAPSVQSTARPSAMPSFSPTAGPTPLPTTSPTAAPSRRPSQAPTRKPSAVPTAGPTVSPSVVPTVVPGQTQAPSRAPTAAPSLSQEALWRATLATVLAAAPVNQTVSVAHRSVYYELDVLGTSSSSAVYGSCSGWRSLLNGDLAVSNLLHKPVTVELVVQQSLSATPVTVRCDTATAVSALLAALTDTSSAIGTIQSVTCSGQTWVVSKCASAGSGIAAPALCVNCADPCAATNHCSAGEGSGSVAPFSVSPCATTTCSSGTSLISGLRVLRVSYVDNVPAPSFLSRSVVSKLTSLEVTAVLSIPGTVYCAAYVLDSQSDVIPAPSSTGSIMLQNFMGATDATNTTVVAISGLQSATDYLVYCLSVSRTGSVQSLSDVLAQPLSPSTTCCIPVTVSTSGAVRELQASSGFLTMTVDARPSIDIVVSVSVFNSTGGAVFPVPLFPSSFRVNALSASTATFGMRSSVVSTSPQIRIQTVTMTSALQALPQGNYTYAVTVSGESVSQYAVVYNQPSRRIAVLSAIAPLPAPVLTSAVFSDDGSYIAVLFDSNTNKGGMATQFTCSALFQFSCASTASCVWSSSRQVNVYTSGAASCLGVDSVIALTSSAVVKAQCPSTSATCDTSAWPKAGVTAVTVTAPSSAVSPTVAISAPSTVGACDALTLDLSGSSGSGGRRWLSRSIQVETSATANVTDLQYFLTNKYQASPPTAIPAELLTKGFSYNFVVTLCNFLGKCSQAAKSVLALDRTVPSVSMPGAALRTTRGYFALTISSDAFVVQCGGSVTRSGLQYAWTVSTGGALLLGAVSTSKDPSKFVLAPYSLQVGVTYDITLTTTIIATSQSASAMVQVYVQQGEIKAVVAQGTTKNLRVGDVLSIDASGSFDEDQAGVTGLSAGLTYSWSCAQVQPVYVSNCDLVLQSIVNDGRAVFPISAKRSTEGAVIQFSLFLLDASLTRSAETVITVTVLPALSPSVSLISNVAATGIFNSNRELQLTGTVRLPETFNGTVVWSVDDTSNFNFAAAVRSPVSDYLAPAAVEGQASTVYLVLAANTLPGRSTLTFSLTASLPQGGAQAVASVVVTVNAPPLAGTFAVTPATGTEIVDQFTFLADRWFDADLPLQYQFGYVSASGAEVTVRSKLEVAFGASTLFAGLAVRDFNVSCVAYVSDALAASSSATAVVQVFKDASRGASGVSTLIVTSLSGAAASVDGLKQATALGSYLLNEVDCSAAPDCAALHRNDCFRTANTCGECMSNAYIGDSGDSNHACVEVPAGSLPPTAFQSCTNGGLCAPVPKTCAANCSYPQGSCTFVNADTGAEVSTCFVGSTDCNAVCDCQEDFIGSETCSLNSTQLLQKQTLRSQVIQSIRDLVDLEDPDQDTVAGWIGSVVTVAQSPDELSPESIASLLDTVTTVLTNAAATAGMNLDTVGGLLRTVDASVQASANRHRHRRRLLGRTPNEDTARQLQESVSALNSTVAQTESILSLYRSIASDSLLPGQDAMSVVLPQFRVLVQKMSLQDSDSAQNVTIQAPSSVLEGLNGQTASRIAVPVGGAQASLGVSLTSMRSELYNTELSLTGSGQVFSSPLSVQLSDTSMCTEDNDCRFEMVLQTSAEMASLAAVRTSEVSFNTTCGADDVSNHSHVCPDANVVTAKCPGYASIVVSRCPVLSHAPVCNSIAGLSVTANECFLVASTATDITCSCPLKRTHRKLQQSADDDDSANNAEATVSYVAMLSQVKNNFVQTILSAQGLNASAAEDGWSAIVTVGCIAAAVLFGLSWAHHADADAAKIKPKSESEKKKQSMSAAGTKIGIMESLRKLFTRKTSKNRAIAPSTKWCVSKDVQIAEQALPAILSSNSLSQRVKDEIKYRHKWLGIVFYFSPAFPRVLRVLSLATNVIIMLFIQSLTYALTNPDDGLCETYTTKPECLAPSSPYATGASKCYWTPETSECALVEPDSSVKIILFVAIFSAIIATPLAMLIDWLVFNILSAPTKVVASEPATVTAANGEDLSSSLAVVPSGVSGSGRSSQRKRSSLNGSIRGSVFGSVIGAGGNSVEQTATLSAQADMSKLTQELTAYRATLTTEQRVEFDEIWGLDEHGYFCSGDENAGWGSRAVGLFKSAFESDQKSGNSSTSNVAQRVLMDLKSVHASLLTETAAAVEVNMSEQDKGKKLLFLFQRDLLPGISGKILDSKGKRDNLTVHHVSFESKVAVWTLLAAANVGMLFYILLFALSQTVHRQGAWALSFVMWLVVEVLFVSSATVLFTHVFIPSLIMQDVNKIKLKLVESMRAFNNGVRSRNRGTASQKGPEHFNAAEYLFVSTRLAKDKDWSDLREAQIITLFRTPWPKQSYQRETDVSKTYSRKYTELYRSVSIVAIFFLTNLLQIPPAFQDMVIHMCTTAAVGYTVLLHIDLYDVFPVLVIVPCLVIGLAVYALIRYNAKRAQRRLEQTFPMVVEEEVFEEEDVVLKKENEHSVQGDLLKNEADPEDALIAQAALDLARGHTTRKQSVVQGLRVLGTLQETRGAAVGVNSHTRAVSSQDPSDFDSEDDEPESKQDEGLEHGERMVSVDELRDSVNEEGSELEEVGSSLGKEEGEEDEEGYSLTSSQEEAMYGAFEGDSDLDSEYEGENEEEDAKSDGEEEGSDGSSGSDGEDEEESEGEREGNWAESNESYESED